MKLATARGDIVLGTRQTFSAFLNAVPPAPGIAGYALAFKDPGAFAKRCREAGLAVKKTPLGPAVALPPALGGTWLLVDAASQEFLRPD